MTPRFSASPFWSVEFDTRSLRGGSHFLESYRTIVIYGVREIRQPHSARCFNETMQALLRLLTLIFTFTLVIAQAQGGQDFSQIPTLRGMNPTGGLRTIVSVDERNGLIYIASDARVFVYSVSNEELLRSFDVPCGSNRIRTLKAHGPTLLMTCAYLKNAFVLDSKTGRILDEYGTNGEPTDVTEDGSTLAYVIQGFLRVQKGKNYSDLTIGRLSQLAFSHTGRVLAAAVGEQLVIFDVSPDAENLSVKSALPIQNDGLEIAFSNDDNLIAVASNKQLSIFNLLNNRLIFQTPLSASPSDVLLRIGADNDTIILSDAETLSTTLYSISSQGVTRQFRKYTVGLTLDGRHLVTQGNDGVLVSGNDNLNYWLKNRVPVIVNATPNGATLRVNGSSVASTGEIQLYPGTYSFTLSAPGFRTSTISVKVEDRKPTSLNVALERMRGRIRLESEPPGAAVIFDGKAVGVTPLTLENLELGDHSYVLALDDYSETRGTVRLVDESEQAVKSTLEEVAGLTIKSTPNGATIAIDGKKLGTTPLTIRNLEPGLTVFTASLMGYQSFIGRAIVPKVGKGKVEIVLSNNLEEVFSPVFVGRREAVSLSLRADVVIEAQRGLIRVNDVPMLPLRLLADLTGLGIYGDATRTVLAWQEREITLSVGEPTRKKPTMFLRDGIPYAPLIGLEKLGVQLPPAPTVVLVIDEDRVDLGKPSTVIATESVVAPLRAPWLAALQQSIVLDAAPAFALRDILRLVRGLSYDASMTTLKLNDKPLLRAFVAPSGYQASLVVYKGSAYLPVALLPLLGVHAKYRSPMLTLTIKELPFDLRFAVAGRITVTTKNLIAEINAQKLRQQAENKRLAQARATELARVESIRRAISTKYKINYTYLGNNRWGHAITLYTQNDVTAYIVIIVATSPNPKSWRSCGWWSQSGVMVTPNFISGDGNGRLLIQLRSDYTSVFATFGYNLKTCDLFYAA